MNVWKEFIHSVAVHFTSNKTLFAVAQQFFFTTNKAINNLCSITLIYK